MWAQSVRSVSELLEPYMFWCLDPGGTRVEQLSVHLPSSSALSSVLNSSHSPEIAFPRLVLLTRGGDGGTCRLARVVILRCFSVLRLRVPVSTTTIFSPQLRFFFLLARDGCNRCCERRNWKEMSLGCRPSAKEYIFDFYSIFSCLYRSVGEGPKGRECMCFFISSKHVARTG